MQVLFQAQFGRGGNGQPALLDGFARPEDGFVWCVGQASRLRASVNPSTGRHLLELRVKPFVGPGLHGQRLAVQANGVLLGDEHLSAAETLGYLLPPEAINKPELQIELSHPDACSPAKLGVGSDGRMLGFKLRSLVVSRLPHTPRAAITALPPLEMPAQRELMDRAIMAVTGMDAAGLAGRFESLGHDCEFGLLQRRVGAEPLDLLRFANMTLDRLVDGLRQGFEGVGDDVEVFLSPAGGGRHEFMIADKRFALRVHSSQMSDEAQAERVREEHAKRLRFLRRLFVERMETGERIYVFQRREKTSMAQIQPLLRQLQARGPNALLFVDDTAAMPPGAVAQLEHGLFHGRISRLAPLGNVINSDTCGWLSLCARTWQLWRARQR